MKLSFDVAGVFASIILAGIALLLIVTVLGWWAIARTRFTNLPPRVFWILAAALACVIKSIVWFLLVEYNLLPYAFWKGVGGTFGFFLVTSIIALPVLTHFIHTTILSRLKVIE